MQFKEFDWLSGHGTRLFGYLSSHIQRVLLEKLLINKGGTR